MISVERLTYRVRNKSILRGVNLDVREGEILAIMGMSGSGKTTLIKCMAGLIRPNSGKIVIDDADITRMKEDDLNKFRRKLGFVFQYAALFDSMDVYDNVAFGLRYNTDLSEKEIRIEVEKRLEAVGLMEVGKLMPAELSGGMQKRVGLARALALNPDYLFYDEPTAGLDPIVSTAIDELILDTREKTGTTSVVVSHNLHSIHGTADKVAMLNDGNIEQTGTVEEIWNSDNPVVRQFINGSTEGPIKIAIASEEE